MERGKQEKWKSGKSGKSGSNKKKAGTKTVGGAGQLT
jgi:hypothetical protein